MGGALSSTDALAPPLAMRTLCAFDGHNVSFPALLLLLVQAIHCYSSIKKGLNRKVSKTKAILLLKNTFTLCWGEEQNYIGGEPKKKFAQGPNHIKDGPVDASQDGLGVVLCQEHDGHLRPVAYMSQNEKNYPMHKL